MKAVVKIGGSLLRGPEHYLRAAEFLEGQGRPVVVVSAMKGVTDLLLELARTRSYLMYEEVAYKHVAVARALGVEGAVAPLLKQLEAALRLPREPWARDHIAAFGERLSAAVLHAVLAGRGVPSRLYDAPVITDDRFGEAEALELEGAREVAEYEGVAVVTGFIGRTRDGLYTTVGRGGSDYIATFVARAIGARRVSLVTDAPGVMTGDPLEVDSPAVVPLMSYEEALEAAKAGAKNFHPRTFKPVLGSNMVVEVRGYASRGTLIGPFHAPPPYKVVAKCGSGSCVVGIGAQDLTKLGALMAGRYTAIVPIPPRQAHEHIIRPHLGPWTA